MTTLSIPDSPPPARAASTRGALKTVLLAWLTAGTLDITCALTYYPLTTKVRPVRILQGISSALLGAAAFQGGLATAALGLALHYLIALIWTVLFLLAARQFKALTRHVFLTGMAYGVVVWAGMNLIVVPLSRARRGPFDPAQAVVAAAILMFCIGLPIAAIIGRRAA